MQQEHIKGSTPIYPGIRDGFTKETHRGKEEYGIFSDKVAKKGNIEGVMWDEAYKSVCYKVKTSYCIIKGTENDTFYVLEKRWQCIKYIPG